MTEQLLKSYRMKPVLLTALFFLSLASNAQVFTSGFESWVGVVPLDWLGEQTTISIDSVEQVDTDVHGGNYAVRLRHAVNDQRKFTTQILHVDSGMTYVMSFWVRGQGRVVARLFDDNAFGGFSPFGFVYDTINTTTWEQRTKNIICYNTCDVAEFTLQVRGTIGPEHLVVDDVNVSEFVLVPPPFHTIQEIQTPTGAGDDSPLLDSLVATTGIVTGVCQAPCLSSYFLQNGTGPYSGIEVTAQTDDVALGDEVTVYGTVSEYGFGGSSNTRIEEVYATIIGSTGNADPDPEPLLPSELEQEQWESVLVHVDDLEYVAHAAEGWITLGGLESVFVGELFYTQSSTAGSYYSVTGVHRKADNNWRLEPRSEEDVLEVVGIDERSTNTLHIYPNPASDVVCVDVDPIWGVAQYKIMDATRRLVDQGLLENESVTLSALPEGCYLFILTNGRINYSARLSIGR